MKQQLTIVSIQKLLGLTSSSSSYALINKASTVAPSTQPQYAKGEEKGEQSAEQNKQRRSAANSAGTEQRVFGLLLNGLLRDLLEQRLKLPVLVRLLYSRLRRECLGE